MKKLAYITVLFLIVLLVWSNASAQCSVCTKTALQLGEKPATGLNRAILYLMLAPFTIVGFIGYRLWRGNKGVKE